MVSGRLAPLTALLVVLGAVLPVAAQPSAEMLDSAARTHFDLGTNHYAQGRFAEAATEFREAHRLSGRPELLYNIHLSERDAGRPRESVEALRAFLDSDAEIPNRGALEARATAMERELAAREARDAGSDGSRPSEDRDPDRGAGRQPVPDPGGTPVGGLILTGVGAALIVAATITGVMALSADAELADRCPSGICTDPAASDDIDGGQTLALTTDILGAAGIVSLGLGIVILAMGGGGAEDAVASSARLAPGRLGWICTF
jgi:hypothetical protein